MNVGSREICYLYFLYILFSPYVGIVNGNARYVNSDGDVGIYNDYVVWDSYGLSIWLSDH